MKYFTNYIEAVNYADSRSKGTIFYDVQMIDLNLFKVVKTRLHDDLRQRGYRIKGD